METVKTFADLCTAMQLGSTVRVLDSGGREHCGRVVSIEKEDGSGKCWNVGMWEAGKPRLFFVRL